MKIAFITTKPVRLESGTEVRNYYLLKALLESKKITSVKLIYINSDIEKKEIALQDPKLHVELFTIPKRSSFRSFISYLQGRVPYHDHLRYNWYTHEILRILEGSDCIFLSELDSFVATEIALSLLNEKKKIVLDCHNVDHVRFASEVRAGSLVKRNFGSILIPVFRRTEMRALKRASLVTCCSASDKALLGELVNTKKISVIPNGVHLSTLSQSKKATKKISASPQILFVGLLSFGPNDDGLRYYLDQIHPLVLKKHSKSKFTIIGKLAPDWLVDRAKSDTTILLKGFVPDLEPYLADADVCICPLRYGSGTRLKILEYMGAGKPVVSTSVGAEGIDYLDGVNIKIADSASSFASDVIHLIQTPSDRIQLGDEARKLIKQNYLWSDIGSNFAKLAQRKIV